MTPQEQFVADFISRSAPSQTPIPSLSDTKQDKLTQRTADKQTKLDVIRQYL